ncbi:N-acetyltransferase family protein [uncultured Cohaesibacter sp.]|uniref:GNAT family N-acetyltransferase n=1 Tax=uncultured Cohaesibacter sp. TaxID=1002546 RepID=UPI002AA92E80|nr:N-acetyltransferase family protein [uncultured Cohaesibacter sp.]
MIRVARPEDAAAITEIYNDAVRNTTAIWNEETVTVQNRADWIAAKLKDGWPLLVMEDEQGILAGYATYGPWRAWDGYRHTVEHSVYVEKDRRGQGIGKMLMQALISEARQADIHVMVAGIEAGNEASIKLHEKLGFKDAGRLSEVGTKFGKWLDLAFLQLTFD